MLALLHHFPVPLDISSIAFCISPYVNVVGTPNLGSFTLQTLSHTPAAGDFCTRVEGLVIEHRQALAFVSGFSE